MNKSKQCGELIFEHVEYRESLYEPVYVTIDVANCHIISKERHEIFMYKSDPNGILILYPKDEKERKKMLVGERFKK